MDVNRIPSIQRLGRGDRIVVEFDRMSCLSGVHSWVMEFSNTDSIALRIRPTGPRVLPVEKTICPSKDSQLHVDELFRELPRWPVTGSYNYGFNFRIRLYHNDSGIANWEFEFVLPPPDQHRLLGAVEQLCKQVPHEYRKLTWAERVSELPVTVLLGLVGGTAVLIGLLWWPINYILSKRRPPN